MIAIAFSRESVSMGDDAGSGEYRIGMPDTATLGDLIDVIRHGGSGNDWPIPYTGANSFWVIKADGCALAGGGVLADVYTDGDGEWHVAYVAYDAETPLKSLGIARVYGARGLDPKDEREAYHGYEAARMTGVEIKAFLADAYDRVGPYHQQVAGERILIQRYKKVQDEREYLVFYNDSFFKIMDGETGRACILLII